MKKELEFKSPFGQWGGLGFYNCYASVYMYLQEMNQGMIPCSAKAGTGCNHCSKCSESLVNLFETMSGQTIVRSSWSGEKTAIQKELEVRFGDASDASDQLVDFIVGFTGYEYKKVARELKQAVVDSVDAGKPVIAKLKSDDWQTGLAKGYRVIIGYDGDAILEPNYVYEPGTDSVQQLTYDQIECIYLFGEKTVQKYTVLDVLKFMEEVMNSDFSEGIWYDFAYHFDFENGDPGKTVAQVKQRFARLGSVGSWLSCMSHSLQTAFRDREKLQVLGMDVKQQTELISIVGDQTHLLHNLGYQATALRDCANAFQLNDGDEWPWHLHGLITSAAQVIDDIIECDRKILVAIKKAIRKIS